jgi:hypothetical protein
MDRVLRGIVQANYPCINLRRLPKHQHRTGNQPCNPNTMSLPQLSCPCLLFLPTCPKQRSGGISGGKGPPWIRQTQFDLASVLPSRAGDLRNDVAQRVCRG